jgi:hypothetical protein
MGATYNEPAHSCTIGLVLLTITASAALLFTLFGIRRKAPATSCSGLGTHQREQDRVADSEAGQVHDQPVDTQPHAAGRRHPVLQSL